MDNHVDHWAGEGGLLLDTLGLVEWGYGAVDLRAIGEAQAIPRPPPHAFLLHVGDQRFVEIPHMTTDGLTIGSRSGRGSYPGTVVAASTTLGDREALLWCHSTASEWSVYVRMSPRSCRSDSFTCRGVA